MSCALFKHECHIISRKLGFLLEILVKKYQLQQGSKKLLSHLGQVDFDISNVIGVVFFTGTILTS
jgi:hypothetical protein